MADSEFPAGINSLLNDASVPGQALAFSALLDSMKSTPPAPMQAAPAADSMGSFGGTQHGGVVGPELPTPDALAEGYSRGTNAEKPFSAESRFTPLTEFDLKTIAAKLGLRPTRDAQAIQFCIKATFQFPGLLATNRDDARLIAAMTRRSRLRSPRGMTPTATGAMTWQRGYWSFTDRKPALWDWLTGGPAPPSPDMVETDFFTWRFDYGDVSTQFSARPIQGMRTLAKDFTSTIGVARQFTDAVRAIVLHGSVNAQALQKRLEEWKQA